MNNIEGKKIYKILLTSFMEVPKGKGQENRGMMVIVVDGVCVVRVGWLLWL